MKVVIDTNVVVSAILRDRLPEAVLRRVMMAPEWEWVGSEEILAEYVAVLRRPRLGLPPEVIAAWDAVLREAVTVFPVTGPVAFARDRKDAKFLACAIAASADLLITGDRDFEDAPAVPGCRILTVRGFVDEFSGTAP